MAISSTEKTEILEIVVGLFNAAPGGKYLTELANAITPPNGMTTSELADFLANHDLFVHGILDGKVTTDQQVAVLMNNFGVVADSDPTSAGSQAQAYFTQQIEAGVGFGKIVFDAVTFLENTTDIAFATPKTLLENKAKVAAAYSEKASSTDLSVLQGILSNVTGTAPYTDADVNNILSGKVPSDDGSYHLTSGTDVATANVFKADLVFNPAGSARVNSLQNEDVLTGIGNNPTLNATLGTANDNGDAVINPVLHNIATINTDFSSSGGGGAQTAGVNTMDLRTSDPTLDSLNITRIGSVNAGKYINIPNAAAHLGVSNNAVNTATATFGYQNGVLAGANDSGDLSLSNVNMGGVGGGIAVGGNGGTEGFEHFTLNSNGGSLNSLNTLTVAQLQDLKIAGTASLNLLSTQPLSDVVSGTVEGVQFNAGNGIANPNSNGLVSIDATGFTGNLGLDISNAVGGHNDPSNSGKQFFTTVTGGDGNDTFYTGNSITGTDTLHDVLNGGAGTNKLVDYAASIDKNAQISNIQSLEIRDQGVGAQVVDFKGFSDSGPSSVLMRNEDSALGASAFTLQNIDPTLASNGSLTLNHGTTASEGAKGDKDTVSDMVKVQLADATGSSDTVALTVNPDKNTTTTFNYTLDTTAMTNVATGKANGTVENVSVADNDAESNILTLNNINDHTGTVTLSGGTAGTSYTVVGAAPTDGLLAATVDASKQASDLFLTAKPVDPTTGAAINQTVKLGTGNDVLTYGNAALGDAALNLLTSNDTVTDAGGNDVVSAVFSKDFGILNLSGVETLQIASTANANGDLAKASGITTLNLLSDKATDKTSTWDQFGLVTPVVNTAVVTLANTNLSTLNFAGQNDNNNLLPGTKGGVIDDGNLGESLAQVFNGVTLSNNASANLTVNINSQAVGNDNKTHQEAGALSYTTGQLTTHGVTDMTIAVGDELAINKGDSSSATMTAINNVFDKNLSSLTVTANGSVNLNTVSGNATNNNMTLLDATKVLGNFAATVISLGDAAQVKIANGGTDDAATTLGKYTTFTGKGALGAVAFANTYGFDALGSAGGVVTPVSITAGNGIDVIRGTAQNDIITTGSNNDIVNGDNGNNVISTGAGDDNVAVGHGNNTISLGSGTAESVTVNLATKLDGTLNTTAVTGNGTAARVTIDADGKGGDGGALGFMDGLDTLGAVSFNNYIAAGAGHDLGIRWTGNTIQLKSSTLDGVIAKATGTAFTAGSSVFHVGDLAGGAADYSKAGAVVLLDYGTDGTAGTGGGSIITGSAGNDAFVITGDAIAGDTITGGAGADRIVLGAGGHGGNADKLIVNDGDSLATAFDQVTNFALQDLLQLQTTNIDGSIVAGTDTGIILSNGNHLFITGETAGGLLTFADAAALGNAVIAGTSTANVHGQLEVNATELMAWLQGHTTALSTTVFTYDHAGVGAATDGIVYQSTPHGTAVELVGVVPLAGVTAVGSDFTVA